jgi:hypothetical protein
MRGILSVSLLMLAMGTAALAHHSTAAYSDKTIVLKNAVVKKLTWANPHCVLSFDVKDASGKVTTWGAESGSPSALSRVGWHRNSLKTGDTVAVEIYAAKNGARVGRLAKVVLPNGTELLDSLYNASPFDTVQKK